ncbi:MAG: G/U mismatch-specific DNA glycosylase [Acidimicrobiales bacterium]
MKPTRQELEAAAGRLVPDLVADNLQALFCGINPGLWSGATGRHFAGPGNRFWKVLSGAEFTDRVLGPSEEGALLSAGLGITNLCARTTATAAELTTDELAQGALLLEEKVALLRPRFVAFVGMQAYRSAFHQPRARIGPLPEPLAGARGWLLPNPSGLQARYQLAEMVGFFTELRRAVGDH